MPATLIYTPAELKRREALRERAQKLRRVNRVWVAAPRSQLRSQKLNGVGDALGYEAQLKQAEKELARFYGRLRAEQARTDKINSKGLALIKEFESYFGRPYNDPVGFSTVGYGHLIAYRRVNSADNRMIWVPGQNQRGYLTEKEAAELLRIDLASYERAVADALKRPVNENQFSACVSLCYNIGPGGFRSSSVARFINLGQYGAAERAFSMWVRGGGEVLPGLVRRRNDERKLFRTKP